MGVRPSRLLALVGVLLALCLAACGEDEESDGSAAQGSEPQAEQTETSPAKAREALKDTSVKPEILRPTGAPPRKLDTDDIVKGKGRAAKAGDSVVVQYVGVAFSTGNEFDASWDAGQPFAFPLGGGQVIEGWDRGIVGMKVGGRRQLTIPPELAYGAAGSPPAIGPNETLVFVVDLLEIR
jgi:peptidylprolyl isomerase